MRLHIVVAMEGGQPAKVECRSCHRQHKYRAALPGTKKETTRTSPRAARPKAATEESPAAAGVNPLEALLSSQPASTPRVYSPAERYAVGDLLSHPNFGLGAVTGVPSPGKIAVLFRDTTRLLLHERTATANAAPRLQPPPRREDLPHRDAAMGPPKVKSVL
jgi:hypothetical protein